MSKITGIVIPKTPLGKPFYGQPAAPASSKSLVPPRSNPYHEPIPHDQALSLLHTLTAQVESGRPDQDELAAAGFSPGASAELAAALRCARTEAEFRAWGFSPATRAELGVIVRCANSPEIFQQWRVKN